RCLPFRCPLPTFERASVLRARGRLWNSTFLEEFLAVASVELIVRASVSVTSSIENLLCHSCPAVPCHAMRPYPFHSMPFHATPAVPCRAAPPWLCRIGKGVPVSPVPPYPTPQVGFFRRARHPPPPAVPRYQAVKIPRQER
ncbi:ITA7 protein, partial [Todus mexicanus]|nr:ITA7 protein [Todus mexicanus]